MNRLGCSAALGIVLLVAASCSHGSQADGGGSAADAARAHRADWEAANISDYTWSVIVTCMACGDWPGPSEIKVKNGDPVQLLGTDYKGNVEPLSIAKDEQDGIIPLTVEDLFDVLDEAYASDAQTVQVTYDPRL